MSDDDFGAGIENDLPESNVADFGSQSDQFVNDFQSMFDIQSEGPVTRDSIADYIERMNKDASEATTLRQRVEQYEQQMQVMASQYQEPQQPTARAEAKEEAKRRYEAAKVDAHLTPFLQANLVETDASGYFQPKSEYRMNPQVIQACQAKNNQLQNQSRVVNDLVADPYDFFEEGAQHSPTLRALQNQLADFQRSMDERIAPLQQQTQESAMVSFVTQNLSVLADSTDRSKWSPAGNLFNRLVYEQGMAPDQALQMVLPLAELSAPSVKPKPVKKPARVIDRISARMNGGAVRTPELNAHGPLNGKRVWRQSFADLRAAHADEDN